MKTVGFAIRMCYLKDSIDALNATSDLFRFEDLIQNVVDRGHESVLEHVSFTFAVSGLSRAASHQVVRHRIASYSQQSQRYVRFNEIEPILPPVISKDDDAADLFDKTIESSISAYAELLKMGIPAEDARYVLPNASPTQIMITMNVRELRHFFRLRLCSRAQWEIRKLAKLMLTKCRKIEPILFKDVGPNCVLDRCREGKQSCGKPWTRSGEPQD